MRQHLRIVQRCLDRVRNVQPLNTFVDFDVFHFRVHDVVLQVLVGVVDLFKVVLQAGLHISLVIVQPDSWIVQSAHGVWPRTIVIRLSHPWHKFEFVVFQSFSGWRVQLLIKVDELLAEMIASSRHAIVIGGDV